MYLEDNFSYFCTKLCHVGTLLMSTHNIYVWLRNVKKILQSTIKSLLPEALLFLICVIWINPACIPIFGWFGYVLFVHSQCRCSVSLACKAFWYCFIFALSMIKLLLIDPSPSHHCNILWQIVTFDIKYVIWIVLLGFAYRSNHIYLQFSNYKSLWCNWIIAFAPVLFHKL